MSMIREDGGLSKDLTDQKKKEYINARSKNDCPLQDRNVDRQHEKLKT